MTNGQVYAGFGCFLLAIMIGCPLGLVVIGAIQSANKPTEPVSPYKVAVLSTIAENVPDPANLKIISYFENKDKKTGNVSVHVEYRFINAFGASVLKETIVEFDQKGKVVNVLKVR